MENRDIKIKQLLIDIEKNGLKDYSQEIVDGIKPAILIKTKPLPAHTPPEVTEVKIENKKPDTFISKFFKLFKSIKPKAIDYSIPEDSISIGISKLGGVPDVIKDFQWPFKGNNPLSFIAQFNLSEIHNYDEEKYLPTEGLLSFFYDEIGLPWGSGPDDVGGWRIYYFADTSQLIRYDKFEELKENNKALQEFYPCNVEFSSEISLPIPNVHNNLCNLKDYEEESYLEIREVFYKAEEINQIFGYCYAIQNNEMEKECLLIPDDSKEDNEWVLLLQLDSDTKARMMWGDCGRLYFWITKKDLLVKNFDRVWLILQCY